MAMIRKLALLVLLLAPQAEAQRVRVWERVKDDTVMATTNWTANAGDGDWGNDANWSGVAPVDGDTVTMLALASIVTVAPVDGDTVTMLASASNGPTTGLTNDTVLLSLLIVEDGVTYDIGSTATPLEIACDNLVHHGQGRLHYRSATTTTDHTGIIIVDARTGNDIFWLDNDGTSNVLYMAVFQGNVTVAGSFSANDLNALYVAPRSRVFTTVTFEAGTGGAATELWQTGGTVVDNRGVAQSIYIGGGQYHAATNIVSGLSVDMLGGYFFFDAGNETITEFNHMAGTLDFTKSNAGQAKTITTYRKSPTAILKYNPAIHTADNLLDL